MKHLTPPNPHNPLMQRVAMHIPSDLRYERVVRASADEIGRVLDLPTERIEDLKVAISEAVTNAIEHGNQQVSTKYVAVVFTLASDHLEVRISDEGSGVDVARLDVSPQVIDEAAFENGGRRGFGLYLISALVDDYAIESSQQGTILTLRVNRREASDDE